jgi:hypothetical protein
MLAMANAEVTLTLLLENVDLHTTTQDITIFTKSTMNLKQEADLNLEEMELPYCLENACSVMLATQDFLMHPLLQASNLVLTNATHKTDVNSSITTLLMASASNATLMLLTALKACQAADGTTSTQQTVVLTLPVSRVEQQIPLASLPETKLLPEEDTSETLQLTMPMHAP